MAFDVAFDLPAKETLGWRGAAKPLLLLEQLTMAHNQDRLQNSDSSVVYGHGHIIYSHTARTGRQQAVQAGDAQAPRRLAAAFSEAIASHSLTWATHHYDKPSNSQLWVWMALLKNTSQSISWRNVHFCIRSYSTLHTVYCGALPPPPKLRIAPFALACCSENSSILLFFSFRFKS